MMLSESLINEYAKRIYGFAYSKINDFHNAEDLSQEIVLNLCGIVFKDKQIENMDAYIYKVCQYTWSKYLRKNKPVWDTLNNSLLDIVESQGAVDEDYVQTELFDKLRHEVMFLSKIRREAVILYYYDNKSGDEISRLLGVPAQTVRWHLFKARNDLKERIEMTQQDSIYRPVKLSIGHYGWYDNDVMRALETDILMQNICYVCFGSALTIEDISRSLGVAAVYLEDKIDKLLSIEYMIRVGKNKYQTSFFIQTPQFLLAHYKFVYTRTLPIATAFFDVVKAALPEIVELGFTGNNLDENILLWDILPYLSKKVVERVDGRLIKQRNLDHFVPIRPDGTKHFVRAQIPMEVVFAQNPHLDDDFKEFYQNTLGYGFKTNCNDPDNVHSIQCDLSYMGTWRSFVSADLSAIKRTKHIIDNGEVPNVFDKEAIASLVQRGYVSTEQDKLSMLVPYFTKEQNIKLDEILQRHADKILDRESIEKTFSEYVDYIGKYIISCVCENERNHYMTSYNPYYAIMWLLLKHCYLSEPDERRKKSICTILWEM
ncbi:MAG: RNA polymerase sigma factor [Eubacteriales bacterium]